MIQEQERDLHREKIKDLMKGIDGVGVKEKTNGKINFRMYLTSTMREASLDVLELKERSNNCLRRAGIHTVGMLVEKIGEGLVLTSIRNLGKTSERDIMQCLFLYQYNSLPDTQKQKYLYEVLSINLEAGTAKVEQ